MKNIKSIIFILIIALTLPLFCLNAKDLNEEDNRQYDYFFLEANRLKMKGDFQKAAEMFQNCILINPKSAISHHELGKILIMAGEDEEAIKLLTQATVLEPKNEWYQLFLANVFEKKQQYQSALDVYQKLSNNNPTNVEYFYYLGDLLCKTKQFGKALEVYNKLEKLEGDEEYIILEKQKIFLSTGNEKKSLRELNRLFDKNPEEIRYYVLLAQHYTHFKNENKTKKAYAEALALDPDNGFLHSHLYGYYINKGDSANAQKELELMLASEEIMYDQKMQILLQYINQTTGDNDNIEKLINTIKVKHPNEPFIYYTHALYLTQDSTKSDLVLYNLEKTVELDGSNEEAWIQLILLAMQNSDTIKVDNYIKEAELNEIKTPQLYFYKGTAAQERKEFNTAKESYKSAIQLAKEQDPIKAILYTNLAGVYYELKDPKKAFKNYEIALSINEHNPLTLNNYAYYLCEEDTLLEKAETLSAKCIELEPGNSTFLDTYAWILFKRGNVLLAQFYIEQAILNIKEDSYEIYDHYADILWANDKKSKAREYWNKAIEAGGNKDLISPKLLK